MQAESRPILTEVVIVGAGIAGLSAANALLHAGVPFKCIEAHSCVGGRVRHVEGFVPWSRTPLGAEFLHGDGTSMYKFCEDNGIRTRMLYSWAQGNAPMEHQKNANGVGMYFFLKSGQSVRTDRVAGSSEWSDILRLHNVFDAMGTFPLKKNDSRNLLEYARDNGVSDRCIQLAEAGFANTLCSSLSRLGLQEVSWLESQWDEDEGEGDYRLDGSLQVVVDKMASAVASDISTSDPVVSVDYTRPGQIVVKTSRKKEYHCRSVILSVPTTVIRDGDIHFNPPLPEEKIHAARAIPMNNCVKIICRFKRRFWPSDVHGAIIADGLVPEVWFDHVGRVGEVAITGTSGSASAASDIQAASLSADAVCTATGFCSAAQIMKFLRDIHEICVQRRIRADASGVTCDGLVDNGLGSYDLDVSRDPSLTKLIHYSMWHIDAWDGHKPLDFEVEDIGLFIANVWGLQGIGNAVYNMACVLIMAMYSLNYRLFAVTMSSKALDRYGGVFSHALDVGVGGEIFHNLPIDTLKSHTFVHMEHLALCVNWHEESRGVATEVASMNNPVILLLNKHVRLATTAQQDFGANLMFYLSHFVFQPSPHLHMEAVDIMKRMRGVCSYVIGIHMRWLTTNQQYLFPGDLETFVMAAKRLAAERHNVGFYIASDSYYHVGKLSVALHSIGSGIGWKVFTNPVISNCSDSSSSDAVIDIMVLRTCDDLIVTQHSTFSELVTALSGLRPVVVSAHMSLRFGSDAVMRATHPHHSYHKGDAVPRYYPYRNAQSCSDGDFCLGMLSNEALTCSNLTRDGAQAVLHNATDDFEKL